MNTKQSDEARLKALIEHIQEEWRKDGISEDKIKNILKPVFADEDEGLLDDSELFDPRVAEKKYEKAFGKKP